jgi:hypothetical protein
VEDNHGGHGGREEEEEEEEDRPLGREETLSKDSAIDNRYDSDEVSPTGNLHTVHCKEPIPKIGNKYSQQRN